MDETAQQQGEEESGFLYGEPLDKFVKPQRDVPPSAQMPESTEYIYGDPIAEGNVKEIETQPSYEIGSELSVGYMPATDQKPKPDYPDAPTIAQMPGLSKRSSYVATLSDDPELVARSIMRDMPNAEYAIDSAGFPYLKIPPSEEGGKEGIYYLDKPGMNLLDFSKFFTRGVMSVPTGLAAGAAFGAGPVAGVSALGAAGAADAALRQKIVKELTGEETFSPTEIAIEGAVSAASPFVAGAGRKVAGWLSNIVDTPNVWEALPRGVQSRIKTLMENAEKRGGVQVGSDAGDMLLDDPNFVGAARALIRQDTEASQKLAESLAQREADAPQRIANMVTRTLGQEPVEKQAIKEFIELPRVEASEAINEAIANATQKNITIPTRDLVERLDKEISTAKGGIKSALINVRKMLMNPDVEQIGPASTRALAFEDRPLGIDNARVAIQSMLKNGFKEEGFNIAPNQLKNQARILGEINSELSNRLKNNVPGLREPFEKYEQMYAQKQAADLGYNFARGGENAVTPNEIQRFLADPKNKELRPYVEAGARLKIDEMMRSTPNDLAAIKKAVKKEGDYSRDNLNILFGKERVSKLADEAANEARRQTINKDLLSELERTRQKTQAELMGEVAPPMEDLTNKYAWLRKAAGFIPDVVRGTRGAKYEAGMADLLSKSRQELDDILAARGMSNKAARDQFIENLKSGIGVRSVISPAASLDQAQEQANGGRVAYKSGGRVKSARAVAEALMREIDQTRKMIGKKTEDILSLPDDAVATALKIARGNV